MHARTYDVSAWMCVPHQDCVAGTGRTRKNPSVYGARNGDTEIRQKRRRRLSPRGQREAAKRRVERRGESKRPSDFR